MAPNSPLSSSLEDYLEVIHELVEVGSVARVKDISDRLRVKRSSVTVALRNLSEKGLVNYSPYSVITLTSRGETVAKCITCKHTALYMFLHDILGVTGEEAENIACKLEHGFESSAFIRFRAFLDIVRKTWDMDELHKQIDAESQHDLEDCGCGSEVRNDLRPHLCTLHDCTVGSSGVVNKILLSHSDRNILAEMGLVVGSRVEILDKTGRDGVFTLGTEDMKCTVDSHKAQHILLDMH
ncbi:MAG: metal-dependent transcriptional regulator [Fibrobacterota bacterium]